jgi:oligosaccharide repeat unit polymerase
MVPSEIKKISMYIRPSDYRELFKVSGPLFAFIIPWVCVLLGQYLELCEIIIPVYSSFYLIVLGNMGSLCLIAFFFQTFFPQPLGFSYKDGEKIDLSAHFQRIVKGLLILYFVIQAFQVVYFQGVPLIWLFWDIPKTYFDFGIQSLNGLLNAIYLLATTGYFLIYLKDKGKKRLVFLFFLLSVPLFLVSRQLLISVFLQIACCALIYRPRLIRTFFKAGLGILFLFVYIGNLRTGLETIVTILGPKDFVPPIFYPFLWIYAYIVTPFNNINAVMDSITPLYAPYYEIRSLLPSLFRNNLGLEGGETGFSLVHENMTVSTFYLEPLLDFGPVWAFVFMALFQCWLFRSYRKAVKSRLNADIMEYAVLYMITILSIFSNLLLFLPVITQLVILNLAKIKWFRKRGDVWMSIGAKI